MTTQVLKPPLSFALGLLLILPSAFFLFINILNEMELPGLYSASEPLLITLGLKNGLGFNINFLIAFGPLIALLLNLSSILMLDWKSTTSEVGIKINAQKRWSNLSLIIISGLCLLILFFYLIGENCN